MYKVMYRSSIDGSVTEVKLCGQHSTVEAATAAIKARVGTSSYPNCYYVSPVEAMVPEKESAVYDPPHYAKLRPEPIEVMEGWGPTIGIRRACAIKYIARAGSKGTKEDAKNDIKKAITYLQRELNFMETGNASW